LTTGRLALARTIPLGRRTIEECIVLARSLEAASRHPAAQAFGDGPKHELCAVHNFPGSGIEGRCDGRRVRIGAEHFCQELVRTPPRGPCHANFDGEWIFLADEREWIAGFELQDAVRPAAAALITELRASGIAVHLASGDRPEVGAELARHLWIERFTGGMSPRDKCNYVERLQRQGAVVAMVGDGLNDAPVLARADVSFAMGCGADAAQLRADIILTGNRLGAVTDAFDTAEHAMRLIRQNFAWALTYNALVLPLAAVGMIGPWEAALGMAASSIVVMVNASRPLATKGTWKASTSSSRSPSYSYS